VLDDLAPRLVEHADRAGQSSAAAGIDVGEDVEDGLLDRGVGGRWDGERQSNDTQQADNESLHHLARHDDSDPGGALSWSWFAGQAPAQIPELTWSYG
jgi:hypothetical protein